MFNITIMELQIKTMRYFKNNDIKLSLFTDNHLPRKSRVSTVNFQIDQYIKSTAFQYISNNQLENVVK